MAEHHASSGTAVILTALEVETRAVLRQLGSYEREQVSGTVFLVGQFEVWRVAVAEVGPGNVGAAAVAERALQHFKPDIALFVGVAGGVKDVAIGDVVVGTKIYGYETGKDTDDGFKARPDVLRSAHGLEQCARSLRLATGWSKRLRADLHPETPRIFVGPIAAGEKVVSSTRAKTAELIREHCGDALAVEMEGRGFLEGVHINHPVQGCVVRGISDLLSGKVAADGAGSQDKASDSASAVAFEILSDQSKNIRKGPRPGGGGPLKRMMFYAVAALLLLGFWAFSLHSARQVAALIFRETGPLREQLAWRILSFNPEDYLLERLLVPSAFANRYGSLENFATIVGFRPLPLQVRPSKDWNAPQRDKIAIDFDWDNWRYHPTNQVNGPRILVQTADTRYSGDLEELNRCRDAAKLRGGRPAKIPVPPFEALGSVLPTSACWLFLDPSKQSMSVAELIAKAERVSAWKWTNYFKPASMYYVATTTDGIVSSMNDRLWNRERYFGRTAFASLSIEDTDCEKYDHCVVNSRSAVVVSGSQEIRDQLPVDTLDVRTDYIKNDHLFLIADVPCHGDVMSLKIIFPIDDYEHTEIVRMAEPFAKEELESLRALQHLPITIEMNDSETSKERFAGKLWLQAVSTVEIPGTRLRLNSIVLAIVLLTLIVVDCSASWLRSKRYRQRRTA